MQKKVRNRLISAILLVLVTALGIYIILTNLEDNIVFFYPPSEIGKIANVSNKVRVGGLVKEGSIKHITATKISFLITDLAADLEIIYDGIVPALFRENQGIVAEGKLIEPGIFTASRLLARHDENYMPPEVAAALKAKTH